MDNTFSWGRLYPNDEEPKLPMPGDMLKVVQDQHRRNHEALVARVRELLCPYLGDIRPRHERIILCVEHPNLEDEDLCDLLGLDQPAIMAIWEQRPISRFSCLQPSCRASITVRNRTHLLRLCRLEWLFGTRVSAGDLVKAESLYEMLCDTCTQAVQHCHDEQRRADYLQKQRRTSELSRLPWEQRKQTAEGRALCNRALLRAGNRCELCNEGGVPLQIHHRCYDRRGQELLSDLIVLCRPCHARFHDKLPDAA